MDIAGIRQRTEAAIAKYGKVDQATADSIVAEAKTPEEKKLVLDELSKDSFAPGVNTDKLAQKLGAKKLDKDAVVGTALGTSNATGVKTDVYVAKDFSPPNGFDNEMQATAAARMSNSDRAAVIKKGERYYAVETNVSPQNVNAASGAPALQATGKVDPATYKAKLSAAQNATSGDAKTAAYKDLAAYTFGVSTDKINVFGKDQWDKRDPKLINVYIGPSLSESGVTGIKGPHNSQGFDKTQPNAQAAVTVEAEAFKDQPVSAQKVLFHEGTHMAHDEQLRKLYGEYSNLPKSKQTGFGSYIDAQKNIPQAQKDVLKNLAEGGSNGTEAVAHVDAFIESFNNYRHNPDKASRFTQEGSELLQTGDITLPAGDKKKNKPGALDAMAKQERQKLADFYRSLGPKDQQALLNVLNDLKSAQPNNFLLKEGPVADILKAQQR